MRLKRDIYDAWMLLETAEAGEIGMPSLATPIDVGDGFIRLAKGSDGNRKVLIPMPMSVNSSPECSSEGIGVALTKLVLSGAQTKFLVVTCKDAALNDIFSDVAGEMMERIAAGGSAISVVPTVIDDYRELLRRARSSASYLELIGLFGELWFLSRLAELTTHATKAWRGPHGEKHDFRSPGYAVEVKTSIKRHSRVVSISSIDQLEPPENAILYLSHLRIEEASQAGSTINDLILHLINSGVARETLFESLTKAGFARGFEFPTTAWVVRTSEIYKIDPSFPRIVAKTLIGGALPRGIINCQYEVDLYACEQWRLENDFLLELLNRMVQSL